MKGAREYNDDQNAYWNGAGGDQWVAEQERLDLFMTPVQDKLIAHARVAPGEFVIDIGCGCGVTSLALAERVGPKGRVIGPDISAPMVAHARGRANGRDNLEFLVADAATHEFPAAVADLLFSRFGVMFFGDPTAAFKNMRRALKPGGRVAFSCWRKVDENPWMTVPLFAVYEHVPRLPKPEPEEPGPFSFADPERVTRILTGAGFSKPTMTPVDITLDLAVGDGLEGAVRTCMKIGASSRALLDQPQHLVRAAMESMRAALKPHQRGNAVPMAGAIWLVTSGA